MLLTASPVDLITCLVCCHCVRTLWSHLAEACHQGRLWHTTVAFRTQLKLIPPFRNSFRMCVISPDRRPRPIHTVCLLTAHTCFTTGKGSGSQRARAKVQGTTSPRSHGKHLVFKELSYSFCTRSLCLFPSFLGKPAAQAQEWGTSANRMAANLIFFFVISKIWRCVEKGMKPKIKFKVLSLEHLKKKRGNKLANLQKGR